MRATLEECRWLYNRLLEERKLAWQETGTGLRLYDQVNRLPALKAERPALDRVHSQALQNVANRRRDFAHQESRKVVNQHGTIAVEDLSVQRLVHNHCLAKSISDAAWSTFATMLSYKAANASRRYVAVSAGYTSQECSRCGHRQKMPLSERVYQCPSCHLTLSRDVNAARNILALGLQSIGAGP